MPPTLFLAIVPLYAAHYNFYRLEEALPITLAMQLGVSVEAGIDELAHDRTMIWRTRARMKSLADRESLCRR